MCPKFCGSATCTAIITARSRRSSSRSGSAPAARRSTSSARRKSSRPSRTGSSVASSFPELIGFPIHWHAVKPGRPWVHGPFTLTAFATQHLTSLANHFKRAYPNTCFDCYGLLIQYEGKRYVYSADLAHPVELAPALEEGKISALLCELTHFPERELFHEVAKYAVQSVWITHYPDHLVRREAEIKLIAKEEKFRGQVHLMHDRVAHEI